MSVEAAQEQCSCSMSVTGSVTGRTRCIGAALSRPVAEVTCGAAAGLRRKRWRKVVRRVGFVCVILVTNLSLLVNQTQAYREIHRRMHMPERVTLGAGMLDYASSAVGGVFRSLGDMASGLIAGGLGLVGRGRAAGEGALSPAGRPYHWQAAVPAAPFSIANMATGNVLTAVPIIGWQGLGRPTSFSLFHNTLGDEPGQADVLGEKWTHSYSRHVAYDDVADVYTLYPDEGGSIEFTLEDGETDVYIPPAGLHMVLERGMAEITLTYKNQEVDVFDLTDGNLLRLLDASGNACELDYETDPTHGQRLIMVTDASGNELKLYYDEPAGHLVSLLAPKIGPEHNQKWRLYEIDHSVAPAPGADAVIRVSTARRSGDGEPVGENPPVFTDPPLFWAEFHTNGGELVHIVDYPVAFEGDPPVPAAGTPSMLTYDADGRIDLVTLAAGLAEEQTRQFRFYPLMSQAPLASDQQGGRGSAPLRALEHIYSASVQGARSEADVTYYYFDGSSRLTRVKDPLGRTVARITWDDDNNPLTTTNAFGGVTTQTYDDRGNVLTVLPPVGGMWEYAYDDDNNLITLRDPLGHETWFEFNDAENTTRPTEIDGPGVSDMTLAWGDESHNLGKLISTNSPNHVDQTFMYGTGDEDPISGIRAGRGQLWKTTHGQGDFDSSGGPPSGIGGPVQDTIHQTDETGNEDESVKGWHWCYKYDEDDSDRAAGSAIKDGPGDYPGADYNRCPIAETCEVEHDADGNRGPCIGCTGRAAARPGEPSVPVVFNGKGQPISLPQIVAFGISGEEGYGFYPDHLAGYEFAYDALGRKTWEEGVADEDVLYPRLEIHLCPYFAHTVSWTFDDQAGTVTREYNRYKALDYQTGEKPITTFTETDLAGRVTKITQNGAETTYAYYDDAETLPAVVETKPDGTISEYYVDLAGQTRMIVHKAAGGAEVLAFSYERDARGRVVRI